MKNTIRRYLGYYFFSNLVFQKSIFMIFLGTQRGDSVAELSILEVALLLGEFFIEIPAGFFGDKFGRKFCVCIGLLALAISSIGYLIFSSFPVFVGLFILEGAGMAFISGADESLLYDNLKSRNQEKEFLPTLSKAMSLSYVSLSIAAVIGGVLQKYSWNLVYGLTSVMIVVAMIFILGIQEETTEENGEEKKVNLKETLALFARDDNGKIVFKIFLILSFFEGTALSFIMFSQQFFHIIGIQTTIIAILIMAGRFSSGGAIYITPKINKLISTKKLIWILMGLSSASFIINIFHINGLYFVTYFALTSLPYMCSILNVNYIHGLLPSEVRASMLSIGNAISSISLGICYLIIGFVLGTFGLWVTVLVLAFINGVSVLTYFIISRKFEMGEKDEKQQLENN